jgi:hypothetical protein
VNARSQAASAPLRALRARAADLVPDRAAPTPTSASSSRPSIRSWSKTSRATRRICDDVVEVRTQWPFSPGPDRAQRPPRSPRARARYARRFTPCRARAGMGKKQRQAIAERLASIPRDEGTRHSRHGALRRRGVRRSSPRHVVSHVAGLVARHHRSVCGPAASSLRRKTRSTHLRLRGPRTCRCWRGCSTGAAAGTRPSATPCCSPASAIPGWPADVVLPSEPVVEARLLGQRTTARSRRRRYTARQACSPTSRDRCDTGGRHRRVARAQKCHRGIPLPATWKRCRRNAGALQPQCEIADPVRQHE